MRCRPAAASDARVISAPAQSPGGAPRGMVPRAPAGTTAATEMSTAAGSAASRARWLNWSGRASVASPSPLPSPSAPVTVVGRGEGGGRRDNPVELSRLCGGADAGEGAGGKGARH